MPDHDYMLVKIRGELYSHFTDPQTPFVASTEFSNIPTLGKTRLTHQEQQSPCVD